ncbi:ABC transporter ATP-binding protein [Oceanobacillus piezotolerans]|uniref:ABC transporter ATP-binding protein n=1 Tax=Oceanobacillus piezotolerans TaxID=2448030 RepID=A0A498D518_9BACI|nr:ABC transporter ATP-binding protein [Oceanobacillus piezotolerans]RLL43995.1 ABC transporter ATP-binding protein [Oceanobacillus piezotolerans]
MVNLEVKAKVLELKDIQLTYGTKGRDVLALQNVNLDIEEGEFVSILGPSGCGKSTLLKIIAGFIEPTDGSAQIDGSEINGIDWNRGVVFQQPALYPWLTVEQNVHFGLKMRKKEDKETVRYFLDKIGLSQFMKSKPYELSGGMKQRAAIARVLVNNPRVLLMDEPFSALDALTREQMQNLLRDIWRETKKTIIFITHDVDEALLLATKVIVMSRRPGRIVKELLPTFTNHITAEDNSVRFTKEFQEYREEILHLINSQS